MWSSSAKAELAELPLRKNSDFQTARVLVDVEEPHFDFHIFICAANLAFKTLVPTTIYSELRCAPEQSMIAWS
jgi:hypothetical protein